MDVIRSTAQDDAAAKRMFGCTRADMARNYKPKLINGRPTLGMFGTEAEFYAISILSDAQETLAHGNAEECRQYINRAKYVLAEAMEMRRELAAETVRLVCRNPMSEPRN